jgi:hypothetical protein
VAPTRPALPWTRSGGSVISRRPIPLPAGPSVVVLAVLAVAVLVAAVLLASDSASALFEEGSSTSAAPDEPVTEPTTPADEDDAEAGDADEGVDGPETSDLAPDDADDPRNAEPETEVGDGRGPLLIQHVGDVLLDPEAHPTLRRLGAEVWDGVRDTFARGDVVIVNLECATTDRDDPQPKQFVFRCPPDQLPAMREAGVTAATVANNHSGDHGVPGILDSLRNVEAAGLVALGAGVDEDEAYAARLVEVQGWTVALLGFGGVVPDPSWTSWGDRPGQASGYDAGAMARAVAAAADLADLVVVSIHWGEEGAFVPRDEDRDRAEAVVAAGADVVFGHHAHRLQPLERIDGVPVFWNLGNFVWPRLSDAAATTAVGEFAVSPDGSVEACLVPFEIDEQGRPLPTDAPRDCR